MINARTKIQYIFLSVFCWCWFGAGHDFSRVEEKKMNRLLEISTFLVKSYMNMEIFCARKSRYWVIVFGYFWGHVVYGYIDGCKVLMLKKMGFLWFHSQHICTNSIILQIISDFCAGIEKKLRFVQLSYIITIITLQDVFDFNTKETNIPAE